jgi:large subunit ribosomal protein L23
MKLTAYDIIKDVILTEKNTPAVKGADAEKKIFTFKVHPDANKIEIGKAVAALYQVKVKSVNVMNYLGKPKRTARNYRPGKRPDWKKAVVTLSEGTINFI